MSIVSGLVLFAVIWFMTLFVMIPLTLETQEEAGEAVEGTHKGAPSSRFSMRRTARWTTMAAAVLWVAIAGVIVFGGITADDIDVFGRPSAAAD